MNEVLLFLSVLPAIVLGTFIYKKDTVEKEPTSLLIKLFVYGIISAIITIVVTLILQLIFPILDSKANDGYFKLFISIYIGVALIEEFFKWLMLRTITWKNNNFTHLYDALVYAVFVSLGFATIENILYVANGGFTVAIIRAILSVPGHTFFGIFMGYYYGLAKQEEINQNKYLKNKYLVLSIIAPVILHGTFDYCLLSENIFFFLFYVIFIITLYILSFRKVLKLSKITRGLKESYCTKCGHVVSENYCSNCGTKV